MVLTFRAEGQVTSAQPSANLKRHSERILYYSYNFNICLKPNKPRVQTSQHQTEKKDTSRSVKKPKTYLSSENNKSGLTYRSQRAVATLSRVIFATPSCVQRLSAPCKTAAPLSCAALHATQLARLTGSGEVFWEWFEMGSIMSADAHTTCTQAWNDSATRKKNSHPTWRGRRSHAWDKKYIFFFFCNITLQLLNHTQKMFTLQYQPHHNFRAS